MSNRGSPRGTFFLAAPSIFCAKEMTRYRGFVTGGFLAEWLSNRRPEMERQGTESSVNTLLDLVGGHRVTAVIYVAAKLGIADFLLEGPKTVAELARLTDTHERSLLRLMRALVLLSICTELADDRFKLTEVGVHLAANSEHSLKAWTLVEGEMLRAGWRQLIDSIRTGKTATELAGLGPERFEALAETKDAGLFNEGMVSLTRTAIPALL